MSSNLKVAIAVVGVANSGKTTTIDLVRQKLVSSNEPLYREKRPKNDNDERSVEVIDGIRVAFCPPGDVLEGVEKSFDIAKKYKAQILVYAQHASVNIIDAVAKKQHDNNCWMILKSKMKNPTDIQSEIDLANEKFAEELANQIKYLIKNVDGLKVGSYE